MNHFVYIYIYVDAGKNTDADDEYNIISGGSRPGDVFR